MGEPAARLDRDRRHHEVELCSCFRASFGSILVQVSRSLPRLLQYSRATPGFFSLTCRFCSGKSSVTQTFRRTNQHSGCLIQPPQFFHMNGRDRESAETNDVWRHCYLAKIVFHDLLHAVNGRPFAPAHILICLESIHFPPSLCCVSHYNPLLS